MKFAIELLLLDAADLDADGEPRRKWVLADGAGVFDSAAAARAEAARIVSGGGGYNEHGVRFRIIDAAAHTSAPLMSNSPVKSSMCVG